VSSSHLTFPFETSDVVQGHFLILRTTSFSSNSIDFNVLVSQLNSLRCFISEAECKTEELRRVWVSNRDSKQNCDGFHPSWGVWGWEQLPWSVSFRLRKFSNDCRSHQPFKGQRISLFKYENIRWRKGLDSSLMCFELIGRKEHFQQWQDWAMLISRLPTV
jgi:hypothetical protein